MATITVQPGDTLSAIGKKLGVDWHSITGYRSGNPNLIYPGEVLTVPDSPATSSTQADTSASTPSAPTPDSLIADAINKYRTLQTDANQKIKDYTNANPFSADAILAKNAGMINEQIDPYYDQLKSDYLLGAERKISRGTQDTQDLLAQLTANTSSYTDRSKLLLGEAVSKAAQGFADSGLFDSGARQRGEGLLTATSNADLTDYTRNQDYQANNATKNLDRTIQDVNTQKPIDLGANEIARTQAKSDLGTQLVKEAGTKYNADVSNIIPPELQANNNFDILKQIGIY